MYLTPDARDAEIDDLSGAAPGELRHRLLGATTAFARAVRAMPEAAWGGDIERTPGHVLMPAERVPLARLREVEIHHADLGLTYGPADWPAEHAELILDHEVTWQVGEGGGPTVAGDASALAWWLSGRPVDGLSCDGGELPEVTTP
jgi:maleylpyruvate isomerase